MCIYIYMYIAIYIYINKNKSKCCAQATCSYSVIPYSCYLISIELIGLDLFINVLRSFATLFKSKTLRSFNAICSTV